MILEDWRDNILNYSFNNCVNKISNGMCRIQQDRGLRHVSQVVTSLSLWVLWFNPRQVHVGFVVDKADWDGFTPSTLAVLCQRHSTNTPCSLRHHLGFAIEMLLNKINIFIFGLHTMSCLVKNSHQSLKSINWFAFWIHTVTIKWNISQLFSGASLVIFATTR